MDEERFEPGFEFDDPPDADSAIESVLGENPRAFELRELITALSRKRAVMVKEAYKAVSANDRIKLEAKIGEMDLQLKVLRDEEAITTFVENSVRATISKAPSALQANEDDEE